MAVFVTGGFGHLGGWICHELLTKGHDLIVIDRARRNLSYLAEFDDRIEYVDGDVLDQPTLWRAMEANRDRIEGIVHIAGFMGGPYYITKPHHHVEISIMGTMGVLEAARNFGVKKMVYISSGSVYGPRTDTPRETDPLTPGDLYGAAKASAELLGIQYGAELGIDFRAVRIYFAYGPGRLPEELYPVYQSVFGSLTGQTKVDLPAGADQALDWTYVGDIAQAVRLVLEAESTKYRRYNVTSGTVHPLPELIKKVGEMAGVSVEVNLGPGLLMPRGPSLDNTRLREELGFSPNFDIEQGVTEYIKWIKEAGGRS